MIKVFIFLGGTIVGAYFNTAVLAVATACCTAAGSGLALLGQKIVQLAS